MKKLLLYVIILIILFAGMDQVRGLWSKNGGSIGTTLSDIKSKLLFWVDQAEDKGKLLKGSLNEKLKTANEKYHTLKTEFDSVNQKIQEKKDQLEKSLKEIEEAKKALDSLLTTEQKPASSGTPQ